MSIKATINEMDQINAEIKRNNSLNRELRKRVKILEEQIRLFLETKAPSGVKWGGRSIVLKTSERRPAKSKSDKERDVVSLLEELGVNDPHKAYNRLVDAQKGDSVEHKKLLIKKIKKNHN